MGVSHSRNSHLRHDGGVFFLVLRGDRPSLVSHILMTADTVHRIGLSVKKEALLLRDSNRSETQRLIDLINPASLYLDGDLHIVKVRIHPPIPQMRILDREILNNRHGGFQGKLAGRRDAGNNSPLRIADFSDDRHCCS